MKIKLIVLTFLFLLVGIISIFFYSTGKPQHGVLHANKIPSQVDGWTGIDIPMEEKVLEVLETRDVLFRVYTKKQTPPVYLCIVFAQNYRKSIHPPEVCFIASGWEVGDKNFINSELYSYTPQFDATQILVARDYDQQMVNYWYKAGDKYTSSVYWHQLNMALNQILFKQASGALIRLSTAINEEESLADAQERLNSFAKLILPEITNYLP